MLDNAMKTESFEKDSVFIVNKRHSISFIFLMFLSVYMVFYFTVSQSIGGVYHDLTYGLFLFVFLYLIFQMVFGKFKTNKKYLILFIVFIGVLSLSILSARSGVGSGIALLVALIGFYMLRIDPLKAEERNLVYYFFVISVFLVLLNGTTIDIMEKGKVNPNNCAMLLAILFCISLVRYCSTKKKIYFIISSICILLQIVYNSRTSLLAIILFVFLSIILKANKKSFSSKAVFWTIFCINIFGVFIAYFYSKVLFGMWGYGKVIIWGKDLFTGRQRLWSAAIDSIANHFLLGVGSHLVGTDQQIIVNVHHQGLGVLSAYGIVVFLLFFVAFAQIISLFYCNQKINRFSALFIIMMMIIGYFEIIITFEPTLVAILIGFGLISTEKNEQKEKSTRFNIYRDKKEDKKCY